MAKATTKGREATASPGGDSPKHWGGSPDPEVNSGVGVEMPLSACRPTPLNELIAQMVQSAVQEEREGEEFESFEESNDLEFEDDELLPESPYEINELEPDFSGYEVDDRGESSAESDEALVEDQGEAEADRNEGDHGET